MLKGSENLDSSSSSCSDPDEAIMMNENSQGSLISQNVDVENFDLMSHDTLKVPVHDMLGDPHLDEHATGVIA
jgi:hypothetical protein